MQVFGPTQLHAAQPLRAPHSVRNLAGPQAAASAAPTDELTLSTPAQLIDRVRELPDIRQDRVREIRAALANGTYETADKLDGALEGLLNEIA